MPDMHVTPETINGHARGCESLADKFGQLADLLHQAKVDDQCFGPIGDAVGMSKGYLDSLEECQNMARQAQRFLTHMSETLADTVRDHQDNDRQLSEMLQGIGKELGA